MLKAMAMRLAGRLEPLLSGTTSDDMPNHCMRRGWERFEIGAYRSLLGAAEELGRSHLHQDVWALHLRRTWRPFSSISCL